MPLVLLNSDLLNSTKFYLSPYLFCQRGETKKYGLLSLSLYLVKNKTIHIRLDMSLKGEMKNTLTLLSTEENVSKIYARLFLLSFGEDLLASLIGFLTFV